MTARLTVDRLGSGARLRHCRITSYRRPWWGPRRWRWTAEVWVHDRMLGTLIGRPRLSRYAAAVEMRRQIDRLTGRSPT